MAKLGIHAFCFTPGWEAKNADDELPPLKELGIGVVELPLLRPCLLYTSPSPRDLP